MGSRGVARRRPCVDTPPPTSTSTPLPHLHPHSQVPTSDENKPRNILEEIVWYKDVEIREFREKRPVPLLQAMVKSVPPLGTSSSPSAPCRTACPSPASSQK